MSGNSRLAMLLTSVVMAGFGTREAGAAFLFDPADGHYYGPTAAKSDWNTAEAAAVALGGHLVAINDAAEEQFLITNFLQAPAASAVPYWIGLNDIGHKGTYSTWSTGQAVTYTNYNPGEPSNSPPGEDYLAINWHYAQGTTSTVGTWNDCPLNGTTGYGGNSDGPYFGIIELNALPVPEPASALMMGVGVSGLLAVARLRGGRRSS